MSETPRTDREVQGDEDDDPPMIVHVEFARILERELIAANTRITEFETALKRIAAYDDEPIWSDDRDDAANDMLEIARSVLTPD